MSPWTNSVQFVADGELVAAGTVNRPDSVIDQNTRYLYDRLNAAGIGQATIAYGVTTSSAVSVGTPVFWNVTTQQFEPALAGVTINPVTNALTISPASDVLGICRAKYSSTLGDITLGGRDLISLTNSVGSSPAPGRYFLSASAAGMLVQQSPSVSIPVCFLDSAGYCYIAPLTRNFLADHVHYMYDLLCVPAGTTSPPAAGSPWVISSPNTSQEGWLPASSFSNAPPNAIFGYNLQKAPNLLAIWPPIPINAAYLIWDQGTNSGGAVVSTGQSGLASIDNAGVWWYSDTTVPWPATFNSASPPAQPTHQVPSTYPFPGWMTMTLVYSVAVFATNKSVVTSLRPASGSPVVVTDLNGNPATAGDLELGLNLGLTVQSGDVAGSTVLKSLTNNQFQQGLVVENLVAGSGITLSSTEVNGSNYQGTVTVALAAAAPAQELVPATIKLADAEPGYYANVPYIDLPSDRSSSITYEFIIPPAGLPTNPVLAIRLVLLGFATGTLPSLSVSYLTLPRPGTGLAVNLPTTTSPTALTITTNSAVTANQYVEATSNTLTVNPGDTVLVYVSRSAPDGYSADTGVLRCGGILQGS